MQQLNQIPGITVSIRYETFDHRSELSPGMSFCAYAKYWIKHYKLGAVKGNTFQSTYEEPLYLNIVPYFGQMQLQTVMPADVRDFFELKRKEGYALETMCKMRACLNAIFITAIEKRCWTEHQAELAYAFADEHPKGLGIQIMLETGIARSELLGLQWTNFNVASKALTITDGLVFMKDPATNKYGLVCDGLKNQYRQRVVPITAMLSARLALEPRFVCRRGQYIQTDYIIHAPRGGAYSPRNWYEREFKPFMHDLTEEYPDIPWITPHEFRHTVATITANHNVNLHFFVATQKILCKRESPSGKI